MHIIRSLTICALPEFTQAAIKRRFRYLIKMGELRDVPGGEYAINYLEKNYVLAPKWEENEEGDMIKTDWILMTMEDWDNA